MKIRLFSLCVLPLAAGLLSAAGFRITPDVQETLDRISADSLRGRVSFLASDLLEGRDTPSTGLDVAAEYIASEFRRAGLEPLKDGAYYETATFFEEKPDFEGFELKLESEAQTVRVDRDRVSPVGGMSAVHLSGIPVWKAGAGNLAEMARWTPEQLQGKAILTDMPDYSREAQTARALRRELRRLRPALVIMLVSRSMIPDPARARLVDPAGGAVNVSASLQVSDEDLKTLYQGLPAGATGARLTCTLAAPARREVKLRNVAGLLRGSDAALKRTYVLVTAHYDHVGVASSGGSDRIYNGANDDASGTASVIELAAALARMPEKPKRSIVFMTYFGEEKGLLGSAYYCRHPLVPLKDTVADVNLEQLGRTDDTDGPQVGRATLTGFDYSSVPEVFREAGKLTGVKVGKAGDKSDQFFARSDNQALADAGIPAHTLVVAYEFPDYHGVGDEWQKLDYPNMAKVDRMIATGVLMIADDPSAPKWNESNPMAARYIEAARALK
jgi:hypothetical protein